MAILETISYQEKKNTCELVLRVDDTVLKITAYKSTFGSIVIDYIEVESE